MIKIKSKLTRKCKSKGCERILSRHNKSGLCYNCYHKEWKVHLINLMGKSRFWGKK